MAELADANTPPYDLARIVCAAAVWFGGAKPVFQIWEMQGPGWDYGKQVVKVYQYPSFFVDGAIGTIAPKKGKRYGWHSDRTKKQDALTELRRVYAHGGFINHSSEALDEALSYVYYDGGGIGPAEFIQESKDAKMCHGDRVIGDMLCLVAAGERKPVKYEAITPPLNSIGGRLKQFRDRKRKLHAARGKGKRRFDFRISER